MTKILLPIPQDAEVQVKVGDQVKAGDILTVGRKPREVKTLELAKLLEVSPQKAKKLLIVPLGDKVEKGEVIARKKGLFGLSQTLVFSPISGKISLFDDKTGSLFIQGKSEDKEEIKSKLGGTISQIKDRGIEVDTQSEAFYGKLGMGEEVGGELFFTALLNRPVLGKIIITLGLTRLTLAKAFGLGAVGAVATEVKDEDLSYLEERSFKFSFLLVAKDDFEKIKSHSGSPAVLFPKEKMLVIS